MSGKIKDETVSTDGVQMDYVRFGQGNRAFVILPGLSVDSVLKYADAVDELKAAATGIIRSSEEDGVAKWLLEHTAL